MNYFAYSGLVYSYRNGIELAGISSDGDPRLLSAMVYETSVNGIKVTQDMTHLCTKARNRLLKPGIVLPMGKKGVSINHLRQLLTHVDKSIHGLCYSDIYPVDRMNYGSFEKMVHERVIKVLRERIPNSEGTVQYLLLFRDIADSFLQYDLEPSKRIFLIFRSLYFLRCWRQYIIKSPCYNLSENFLTYNAYMCVEINAYSLIELIKMFRNRDAPGMFLPCIFDSQACERIFRVFRSMGTTQNTKINFSILELIHKIGRLEVQNDIAYCKLNIDGIDIPHKRKGKTKIYALPSDNQISDIIKEAKQDALQKAETFGLTNEYTNVDEFKFDSKLKFEVSSCDERFDEEIHSDYGDFDSLDENYEHNDEQIEEMNLSDLYVDSDAELDEKSPLTYILDENGERKKVLKSTLVWSLVQQGIQMSNDRSRRFQFKRKASETIDKT